MTTTNLRAEALAAQLADLRHAGRNIVHASHNRGYTGRPTEVRNVLSDLLDALDAADTLAALPRVSNPDPECAATCAGMFVCAECGTATAGTYVVSFQDGDQTDREARTEVCRACDIAIDTEED